MDRNLQQPKGKITVDLGFQLDLNVEIELKAQAELLTAALVLIVTAPACQTSKSFASCVSDLINGVTGSVLDHVASAANEFASGHVLSDVVEWASLSALLLALAVSAASRGGDIRSGGRLGVRVTSSSPATTGLAAPRLRL
jgi:hypothetical protein